MTWVRFDDLTDEHPKVAGLSDRAFRWWFRSLCYASRHLTDGTLPAGFLMRVPAKVGDELRAAGLWKNIGDVLTIHDYLTYQPSKASVTERRRKVSDRVRNWRGNAPSNDVTSSVGNAVSNAAPDPDPVPQPQELSDLTLRESVGSQTFDDWYRVYPKKKNRGDAEKAWKAIDVTPQVFAKMMAALSWQVHQHDWVKQDGQFVPYPASYLRARGWEDERRVAVAPAIPRIERPKTLRDIEEMEAKRHAG